MARIQITLFHNIISDLSIKLKFIYEITYFFVYSLISDLLRIFENPDENMPYETSRSREDDWTEEVQGLLANPAGGFPRTSQDWPIL